MIFAVIEILTVQLTTIWFAVGSIGAIIAKVLGANDLIQLTVFVLLSLAALLISRPYVKKFTKTKVQPTNADMLIGEEAVVTEDINNTYNTGQATIRGLVWIARTTDNSNIGKGAIVIVERIEGAKLIVHLKQKSDT